MAIADDQVKDLPLLLYYCTLTFNSFVFSTEHVQFAFKLVFLFKKKTMKLTE